ncbi:hypothetical protein Btru_052254 [Bulinus truncatus]|nr:hypothetical protein Btru_052254 [Bulinus truncatus]
MSVAELHHAILNGNTNQVRQLITLGADVNQKYGQETAFSLAIQQNQFQCADQVIDCKSFNPNALNQFQLSPLHVVAKNGHISYLRKLLCKGADINAINNQGMTPLSVSTWHGTYHCTKLLLDHGALLTIHDKSGRTPLMIACSNVHLEVVKVILHYGCDVSILDPDMRSALIYALPTYYARHVGQKKLSDMISICELIINTGCDLNKQDRKGWTALHHAVDRDCVTSLCLLVQNNCHLDVQDKSGYTPLHLCLKKTEPNFEMAQLLVYYGAKVQIEMPLRQCGTMNVLFYIHYNVPVTTHKLTSKTLIIQLLFEAQIPPSINKVNQDLPANMITWLHNPCSLQHLTKCCIRNCLSGSNIIPKILTLPIGNNLKRFLNLGLNEKVNFFQLCLLHMYISESDKDNTLRLLEGDISLDFPINGTLPLEKAIEANSLDITKTVFDLKPQVRLANLNHLDDNVFHLISKYNFSQAIHLVPNTNFINDTNSQGLTPLQTAVNMGQFHTAEVLIKHGAMANDSLSPYPMIHLAAASGATSFVHLLLSSGVDPNMTDQLGNTPLHVAASKGNEYLMLDIPVPALYTHEALAAMDICKRRVTGQPSSLTRQDVNHAEIIQLLILNGANPTLLNNNHKTPTDNAQLFQATDILQLLKQLMSNSE